MGLLYEMVLKKRKSAFLLHKQGKRNQLLNENIRPIMPKHESKYIAQQLQHTTD